MTFNIRWQYRHEDLFEVCTCNVCDWFDYFFFQISYYFGTFFGI